MREIHVLIELPTVNLETLHLEKIRLIHHENQVVLMHPAAVRIYQPEVVHLIAQEHRAKQEMAQTHAGQGLRLSNENNPDCAREYLNLIFLKKSQEKN
jgi:hypothetical protein